MIDQDSLDYPNITWEERAPKLPLGIFEAYPPQGNRVVTMTAQVEGDDVISFLFHGATWITRDRFEASSVPGFKGGDTYYRVLQVTIFSICSPKRNTTAPDRRGGKTK